MTINPLGSTSIGKTMKSGFSFNIVSSNDVNLFQLGVPSNEVLQNEDLTNLHKGLLALHFILNNYNQECSPEKTVGQQLKAKCNYVYTDIIAKKYATNVLDDKRLPQEASQNDLIYNIKYFLLTKRLEKYLPLDQFLSFLLNYSYYGNGVFGIKKAAYQFFGKDTDIHNLSLPQTAFLIKNLFFNNSYVYPSNENYNLVVTEDKILETMNRLGYISAEELQKAKKTKLSVSEGFIKDATNQYNIYFKDLIEQGLQFFNKTNSINVYTTLNSNLQSNFASVLSDNAKKYNLGKLGVIAIKDGNIVSGLSLSNKNNNISFDYSYPTTKITTLLRPLLYLAKLEEDTKMSQSLLNRDVQNIIIQKYLSPQTLSNKSFESLSKDDRASASLTTKVLMDKAANQLLNLENEIFASISDNHIEKLRNELGLGDKFLFSKNNKTYSDSVDLQSIVNTYAMLNENGNFYKNTFISNVNSKKPKVNENKLVNYSIGDISKILSVISVERAGDNYFQVVYDRNIAIVMYRGYTIGIYLGNNVTPEVNFYVNRYPVLKIVANALVNSITQSGLIKADNAKK